ncbi:MAG: hypothetical protein LBU40_06235 [Methanobrevibacter sp.]|jgi:hypothetical protein|nr:hypothetical protein [Methanobrevibacter sp.]
MIINQELVMNRGECKKSIDIIIDFIKMVSEKLTKQNNQKTKEIIIDFDSVNLLLDSVILELSEKNSPNFYLFRRIKNMFNISLSVEGNKQGIKILEKILLTSQKYLGENKDFADAKFEHEITLFEAEFYETIVTNEEEDKKLLSGLYDVLKEI